MKKKTRVGNKLFLLLLSISFAAGCLFGDLFSISWYSALLLSLTVGTVLAVLTFRLKGYLSIAIVLATILFCSLGAFRFAIRSNYVPIKELQDPQVVHIQKTQPTSNGKLKYTGYLKSLPDHPGIIIYSNDITPLKIGHDYSLLSTIRTVSPPLNPDEFDYKYYLEQKGIYYQAFLKQNEISLLCKDQDLLDLPSILNQRVNSIFRIHLSPSTHSVVNAMFLGDKSYLDKSLKSNYINSGTMHILAVSGLHVGILYYILLFVITKGRTRRKLSIYQALAIITGIWFYALLAGLPTSVVRAGIMFTFLLIGKSFSKSSNTFNSIALAGLIILLIDPTELFTVSFQLSFIAVLSIITLYPIIAKAWTPTNKLVDQGWQIISVSLAAQLGVLGLSIYYFHSFPTYFLFANLFAIPLAGLILILSISSLAFSFVPVVSTVLFWLLETIVSVLNFLLDAVAHLPFGSIDWLHIPLFGIIGLGLVTLLFFQFLRTKNRALLHASLIGFTITLGALVISKEIKRKKTELWVYQTPKATAIGLLEHKQNHLFGLGLDSSLIRYHLRDHWIKTYRDKPVSDFPNLKEVNGNYIGMIGQEKFAIISNLRTFNYQQTPFSFIVYTNNALKNAEPINNCKLHIIDGSNSYWVCRQLQMKFKNRDDFYFTPFQGAKAIELSLTD